MGLAMALPVIALGCGGSDPTTESRSQGQTERLAHLGLTSRIPQNLISACERAATKPHTYVNADGERVSVRAFVPYVYCPPVVPKGPLKVKFAGPSFNTHRTYEVELLYARDQLASGRIILHGHFILEGGSVRFLKYLLNSGRGAPRTRVTTIVGIPVRIYYIVPFSKGGGEHGGHVTLFWRFRGRGYVVSLHGYGKSATARAIASALIHEMRNCTLGDQTGEGARPGLPPVCHLVIPGFLQSS